MAAELFLIEIFVRDWPASVAWYLNTLGLTREIDDPDHGYALLAAGSGRIALKQKERADRCRESFRLTFQVDDLNAEWVRLRALGVDVGEPITCPTEGYQEIRLTDPDGTPISLFGWSRKLEGLGVTLEEPSPTP